MNGPVKARPEKFTKWDHLDIKGPQTLQEIKDHLESTYDVEISMFAYGSTYLYTGFGKDAKKRLGMKV